MLPREGFARSKANGRCQSERESSTSPGADQNRNPDTRKAHQSRPSRASPRAKTATEWDCRSRRARRSRRRSARLPDTSRGRDAKAASNALCRNKARHWRVRSAIAASVNRFNIAAATKKIAALTIVNPQTNATDRHTGGNCAHLCARITRVVDAIGDSIESHRRRARANHRDDNPNNLPNGRYAARRQHRAQKSKRQREQRMLDFDHLERGADVLG